MECCRNQAITLGERYRGGQLPGEMNDAFIYADFASSEMFWVETNADGSSGDVHEIPLRSDARPVWVSVGPDGHIYYMRFIPYLDTYELRRVRYSGSIDQPPVIDSITANPTSGSAPLTVNFSAVVSDPDDDPITYSWDFGDGSTSSDPSPTYLYQTFGVYTATLTVSANGATGSAPPVTIQVGSPPTVQIDGPIDGSLFQAGETLLLESTASDLDGSLTASSYAWSVSLIHDNHEHGRFSGAPGPNRTWVVPTDGHDYRGSTGYAIRLTVTDSDGLTASDEVTIYPEKVDLTFTNTSGEGEVIVDGITQVVPYVLDTAVGFNHDLDAPVSLCVNTNTSDFDIWSDNGARQHPIITPPTDTTYIATYTATGGRCCDDLAVTVNIGLGEVPTTGNDVIVGTPLGDTINGLAGDDTICGMGGPDTIFGGGGIDRIFGGDGADLISGQGGNDALFGENGADRVNGGPGNDDLFGGPGNDDLRGQGGNDTLNGEAGIDQFFAGSGADTINTGIGGNAGTTQIVQGQSGSDTIFGSPQDDVLDGGLGQDEIHGGAGNDVLNGGRSGDTLFGDDGDDQLFGGPDRDTLSGGAGTDTCDGGGATNDTADNTCETTTLIP